MFNKNILTISTVLLLLPTFYCFAPKHKGRHWTAPVAPAVAAAASAASGVSEKEKNEHIIETAAFMYLKNHIPESHAGFFSWSKTAGVLNALRQKKLAEEMKEPNSRTRKEHDLDWAIQECMSPQYNKDLAEMFMRCAEQDIKINDSSLISTLGYTKAELRREFTALQNIQNEAYERIKLIKALQCLITSMKTDLGTDTDSDVEDYSDQHMFDHTRTQNIQPQFQLLQPEQPQVQQVQASAATSKIDQKSL